MDSNSSRGLSPSKNLVTSVYKTLKHRGQRQFKRLENLIRSKSKSPKTEKGKCVDGSSLVHNFTPSLSGNSVTNSLNNNSISTTSSNSISDNTNIQPDSGKSCLDDDILDQLVMAEYERAHITNMHDVYEIGNSTPSTENCKCNICSFYNGSTPPSMTGIDPDMYPKCIYKHNNSKIFDIKRKIVGAKKTLCKYLTNL